MRRHRDHSLNLFEDDLPDLEVYGGPVPDAGRWRRGWNAAQEKDLRSGLAITHCTPRLLQANDSRRLTKDELPAELPRRE